MLLLSCRGLKKELAEKVVLKDVNLDIAAGNRIGLIGRNGAGKTTLANILAGQEQAEQGTLLRHQENMRIGYLLQTAAYTENHVNPSGIENDQLGELIRVGSELGLANIGGWTEEHPKVSSGGERVKLALAKIWISNPELLILDEPTNNLDLKGLQWLIEQLRAFRGAVLMISHDRYFLDQTVDQIIELEQGITQVYNGNYSFYRQEKERLYQSQLHRFQVEKKEQEILRSQINRLDNWAGKAHAQSRQMAKKNSTRKEFYRTKAKKIDKQVKAKLKRMEKQKKDGIKRPADEQQISFQLKNPERHGKKVIEVSGIEKSYDQKSLFKESSFYVQHHERVALLGENGCGKTTLLKIILGEEKPDYGQVWLSPTIKLGYLSQDMRELDLAKSVLGTLGGDRFYNSETRSLLVKLGIEQAKIKRPLAELSLGERTRLQLARLILQQCNCLILDEPTNNLDLSSREELEKALLDYPGTLIIVSHDRYLLEKLADKLIVFDERRVKRLEQGYRDYRNRVDHEQSARNRRDEKMRLENRLSQIISQLSLYSPADPEYQELDREYQELITKKKLE